MMMMGRLKLELLMVAIRDNLVHLEIYRHMSGHRRVVVMLQDILLVVRAALSL